MGAVMIMGSFVSTICFIGVLFCTIFYEWKKVSPLETQASLKTLYHAEGLWTRCSIPTAGVMTCDMYGTTLFNVPGYLQALRALAIISSLLLFCSALLNILALDCVTCIAPRSQAWLARFGGGSSVLGGCLIIAAVSWYASDVIRKFNYTAIVSAQDGFRYTFGACLYIGWLFGGLALICGAVVLCFSCCTKFEDDDAATYTYKPPKSRTNEEYV